MDPHRSYKHTRRQRRRWWWCCGAWWEPLVNALLFIIRFFRGRESLKTASLASSSSNHHQNIWGRSPVPIFIPGICVGIWDTMIWGGEGGRQDDDCYGKSRECSLRCIPPSHHNRHCLPHGQTMHTWVAVWMQLEMRQRRVDEEYGLNCNVGSWQRVLFPFALCHGPF